MQASFLTAFSTMSNSLGAYLRPSRLLPLPTFTNGNGNGTGSGNPYEELSNGVYKERRKAMSRSRRIVRYCLIPSIVITILVFWYSTREAFKEPEPQKPVKKVKPFDHCAQVIADNGIPSVEDIIAQAGSQGSAQHISHEWPKVVTADQLMDMLENGQLPGPRILHQSWKNEPLPSHFVRWSTNWKRLLDDTWL
jgi:hypothetical protein